MAYQINKTDGTIVATVADGQVDVFSTDLTLVGKNYSGYGEYFNENFVKLLENFSSTAEPEHPIKGQIWFDGTENKLKVYTGAAFVPVSSATISNSQPSTLGVGDLWFNDTDRQLYFFDGVETILLGPSYSETQGLSGFQVRSILDSLNQTRVITLLYNGGTLLGIFSKESFTPKTAIIGFSGSIQPGFNAGTLNDMKFDVTVTDSEQLGGVDAITYMRKDTSNQMEGQLRINTDLGIVIGSAGQANLSVNNGNVILTNASGDRRLTLNVRRGIIQEDAIDILSADRVIQIYEGYSDSQVNFGGNVVIEGDLTVNGETVTIETETLTVEDKNIQLAKQTDVVPTDANADGGGIILEGTSKHILLWSENGIAADADYPELAADAWTSSEHFNLSTGKEFKIDGVTVLSGTSLGTGITSIPGVTSFGKQTSINIGPGAVDDPVQMLLEDNRISTVNNNDDLELSPDGTGNVALIGSPRITGLQDPNSQQDAATKEYVDDIVETRNIVLSMDLTDSKPNSYIITNVLNNIAPPGEYRDGVRARILATILANASTSLEINPLISQSTAEFTTPTGTANAVTNVAISTATVNGSSISTTRVIKEYQIIAGSWTFLGDTLLPP